MNKRVIAFFMIMLTICTIFTGCSFGNKKYYSDVPLDLVYSATLKNYLEVYDKNHDHNDTITKIFAVSQKYETVAGEERLVTYMEWRQQCEWYNTTSDISYTYLGIGDKSFVLNEETHSWQEETSTYYNFASNYTNIVNSDSFRYYMTSKIWLRYGNGIREFPDKYITAKTDEYIEYTWKDGEFFRISNDDYNVLLKYDYDTHKGSREIQEATFDVGSTLVPHLTNDGTTNGVKTEHIPYLDTITASMLAD